MACLYHWHEKPGTISWKETCREGNSVQKSDVPGVAIGCDHAGENVYREDKTCVIKYNKEPEQP